MAEGACDLGYTDSDDFFVAKDEGKPVAMLPIRLEDGRTICIPNTVSIIEGTRRPAEASQARGLPALPGDRGRAGESEIPPDSSRPGERGGLAGGSGPNEGLGGGGLSLVGSGERSGSLPGLVESRVCPMSLASECGWALIRAFAIAVAALVAGHSVRDLIASASRRGRAVAWFLLLTPYLTPAPVVGYAYGSFALSLLHHPAWNQLFYAALLWLKLAPLAALVLYFAPSALILRGDPLPSPSDDSQPRVAHPRLPLSRPWVRSAERSGVCARFPFRLRRIRDRLAAGDQDLDGSLV